MVKMHVTDFGWLGGVLGLGWATEAGAVAAVAVTAEVDDGEKTRGRLGWRPRSARK